MDAKDGIEILENRSQAKGISFLPLKDALTGADFILSTVTTSVAEEAARSCAEHIRPGQIYIDLNATAPSVKRRVAEIIQPDRCGFRRRIYPRRCWCHRIENPYTYRWTKGSGDG